LLNSDDTVNNQPVPRLEGGDLTNANLVRRRRFNGDGIANPEQRQHTAAAHAKPLALPSAESLDKQGINRCLKMIVLRCSHQLLPLLSVQ
jgi:hypothetical protein